MKPIRYRVLLAEQLSQADKIFVTAKVSTMFTGPEAEMHSYRRLSNMRQWVNEHWAFEVLDHLGRVVVMKYKGAEVAMYVKRQITFIEPLPGDPVPEGVLKDPQDVWQRLDLLGASARQVSGRLSKQKKSLEEQLRLANQELEIKERLIGTLETQNLRLSEEAEKWKGKTKQKTKTVGR